MRVMIQLREDAALELHKQSSQRVASASSKSEIDRLLEATAELGVSLVPVHPRQVHPLLAPHFMVEVPDRETAERVIGRLQRFGIVEAAYLQPDAQPS
jgi:hypothetical protein